MSVLPSEGPYHQCEAVRLFQPGTFAVGNSPGLNRSCCYGPASLAVGGGEGTLQQSPLYGMPDNPARSICPPRS